MTRNWGVWISHDIDHIRVREHYFRDLFLFRFLGVSGLEVLKGRRSAKSMAKLKLNLFKPNSWDNFDELMALEKKHRIPSTWFFAVNRGKSLSYTIEEITPVVKKLQIGGFDLGLHGQRYADEKEIRREFELFKKVTGKEPKGIRMHYLQMNKSTLEHFSDLYMYDSSVYDEKGRPPKKTLHLIEIPIHIMDTYLFSPFYKNFTIEQAKEYTKKMLNKAKKNKRPLVFDLHPHHYCDCFPRHKQYIDWLYSYITKNKIERYKVNEIINIHDKKP